MIFSPFIRFFRILHLPLPTSLPTSPVALLGDLFIQFLAAVKRLDLSLNPQKTIHKLGQHEFTIYNTSFYVFMILLAIFDLSLIPSTFLRIALPIIYTLALLIPLTSQFVFPATPIFSWLLCFFSARYIPSEWRPSIHVVLLPTLESVLYGANISDILTRFTHPVLDVLAWIPYGVAHFALPFIVALFLWVAGPKGSIQFFGKAFGVINLAGVVCQLLFPCAAPCKSRSTVAPLFLFLPSFPPHMENIYLTLLTSQRPFLFLLFFSILVIISHLHFLLLAGYEIIHGLTPADYSMPGSPGGLMRIDRVFGTQGYTNAFGSAPLVFGAFPSLHAGTSTMEALFLTHFFPRYKGVYWGWVGILYWATMYLTHHYLIDVVSGGCLAMITFFYFMPKEFKDLDTGISWDNDNNEGDANARRKAEEYELAQAEDHDHDLERELELDLEAGGNGHGNYGDEDVDFDIDDEIRKLEQDDENIKDDSSKAQQQQHQNQRQPKKLPRKSSMTNMGTGFKGKNTNTTEGGPSGVPSRKVSWGATEVLGEATK